MDNKIVNLELKMINVEKTVQMVEQETRVSISTFTVLTVYFKGPYSFVFRQFIYPNNESVLEQVRGDRSDGTRYERSVN